MNSIRYITLSPLFALLKTIYFLFSYGISVKVIKNQLLFVSFPLFALLRIPALNRIYLVLKFFAVDESAAVIDIDRVTGLEYEVGNNAMEDDVVVVAALSEGGEVDLSLERSKLVSRCKRIED